MNDSVHSTSYSSSLDPYSTAHAGERTSFAYSCRKTQTVVVAIRGTMSLADLVTDAVVHPECLSGWLPVKTRKVCEFRSASYYAVYSQSGPPNAFLEVALLG